MIALQAEGLSKSWGAFQANSRVSLRIEKGVRHALIGPNGAGKTTLVNLLTGVLRPDSGTVRLAGKDVTPLSQAERVVRGLARTFQLNTLFPGLTVLESVALAVLQRCGKGARFWGGWQSHTDEVEEARALLATLRLESEKATLTRKLPYGKQRLLEIALALAMRPKVLLLDEPAAGIPAAESAELFSRIAALPEDVSILFIEHDMNLVFRFAQQITVLAGGEVLEEGSPAQIASSALVRKVYLGEARHG